MDVDELEVVREEEDVLGIYEGSKWFLVFFVNIEVNEIVLLEELVDIVFENYERLVEEEELFLVGGVEDIYLNRDEFEDNEFE